MRRSPPIAIRESGCPKTEGIYPPSRMSLPKARSAPVDTRMTKGRFRLVNMYLTDAGSAQVTQCSLHDRSGSVSVRLTRYRLAQVTVELTDIPKGNRQLPLKALRLAEVIRE
jgi:hypothetical protein